MRMDTTPRGLMLHEAFWWQHTHMSQECMSLRQIGKQSGERAGGNLGKTSGRRMSVDSTPRGLMHACG